MNKQGYSTMTSISDNMASQASNEFNVRKARTEDDYFNEDDETDYRIGAKPKKKEEALPYQPAPGSPGGSASEAKKSKKDESDSEEDPLDAFMANLEKDAQKQGLKATDKKNTDMGAAAGGHRGQTKEWSSSSNKGVRADIEDADEEESYYKWLEENPNAGRIGGDDDDGLEIEYDEDGNPIAPAKSKHIDPLGPFDHSSVNYETFERNFYTEHPDIAGLSRIQVIDLQHKLGIRVSGASPPKPVSSFGHFGFDDTLLKAIRKSEFTQPTPIQSQGIPALLSGRDCIGIAKTGSGKTAAFLWPMLVHIMDQRRLEKGNGCVDSILQVCFLQVGEGGRTYCFSVSSNERAGHADLHRGQEIWSGLRSRGCLRLRWWLQVGAVESLRGRS